MLLIILVKNYHIIYMLKKIIITVLGSLLVSSCIDGFRGYLQKFTNNKIIDIKYFDSEKRSPFYNKKHISTAKKNTMEKNFNDNDENLFSEADTETINPTLRHHQMYHKTIEQDMEHRKKQKLNQNYPSLNLANDKVKKQNNSKENSKLYKELKQIKSMLYETKKDLERYSCPTQ